MAASHWPYLPTTHTSLTLISLFTVALANERLPEELSKHLPEIRTFAAGNTPGYQGKFIFPHWLDPNNALPVFLFQVFLTLLTTRICGKLLSYLKQPPVIGEIIGGIILGPSVLGYIPGYTDLIWPTQSIPSVTIFTVVSNVGLIFFMFCMGMELDTKLMIKQWRTSVPIATSAIIIPFGVGTALSYWLIDVNDSNNDPTWESPNMTAFILFCGTSMSFTAFPVLASILSATSLLTTPLGIQAMSCAAIDDIMAWCILAISSSFSRSGSAANGGYTCLLAAGFVVFMLVIVRPLLKIVHERFEDNKDELNNYYVVGCFMLLLAGAMCAEVIGIHAFFGSFMVGIVIPRKGHFLSNLIPKLEVITSQFLLPLFFASSGIKTQIGSLDNGRYWGITIGLIIIAFLVKFIPAALMTKLLTKRGWKYSCTIGILMNTRGLVELIALNVARDLRVLSPRMFTMLVIMAVCTTIISAPLMYFIYQKRYEAQLEQNRIDSLKRISTIKEEDIDQQAEDQPVIIREKQRRDSLGVSEKEAVTNEDGELTNDIELQPSDIQIGSEQGLQTPLHKSKSRSDGFQTSTPKSDHN